MDNELLPLSENIRTRIGSQPLFPIPEEWQLPLWGLLLLASGAWAILLTLRDRKDQSWGVVAGLLVLRLALTSVLLLAAINLVRHREQVVETPSSVAIVLDSSLSMSLADLPGDTRRFDAARTWIESQDGFAAIRQQHQLVFYRLGNDDQLLEFARLNRQTANETGQASEPRTFHFPWFLLSSTVLLFILATVARNARRLYGLLVLSATLLLVTTAGWGSLNFVLDTTLDLQPTQVNNPEVSGTTGLPAPTPDLPAAPADPAAPSAPATSADTMQRQQLSTELNQLWPDSPSSPLVQSLLQLLDRPESRSLAAVFLLSDGVDSQQGDYSQVADQARQRSIPMFPIGLGSTAAFDNVAVNDLDAPPKVFQGNPLTLSANLTVETTRPPVKVEAILSAVPWSAGSPAGEPIIQSRQELEFQQSGRRLFSVQIDAPAAGSYRYTLALESSVEEINTDDNVASIDVEVVDQKTRVLLFAGGPSRDFRFLRNQLYRDPHVELAVLLQSADEDAFQEADQYLTAFPDTDEALFDYDCLVAFDPDWSELTVEQNERVRRWVADQSGGMIVVAGPVNTPIWTSRPENDPLTQPVRKLYPVTFFSQLTGSIKLGRFGGEDAFPLEFSPGAASLDFLRFDEDPAANQRIWSEVKFYGYYAVNEAKAGAEVIARFSDPLTRYGGELPIYLASQLYGSGRVYFQASGELWRTRGVGPEFFEQYYSRLIRWTSQGRLLRDDLPLTLTLDRDRCVVGETITVRATVNRATSDLTGLDSLVVSLLHTSGNEIDPRPDAQPSPLELKKMSGDTANSAFEARLRITAPGRYRFKLPLPGDPSQILEAELLCRIPNVELHQPGRNDSGLKELAEASGGKYQVYQAGPDSTRAEPWLDWIPDHSVQTISALSPDPAFTRKLQFCLFTCFALFLTANWLIRRLNRLA